MANLFISQVNVFHILINLAYLLQMLELSEFAYAEVQTLARRRLATSKGCDDYSFKSPGRQASLSGLIWEKTPPVIAESRGCFYSDAMGLSAHISEKTSSFPRRTWP